MGRVEEETVDCEKRVAALESEEGELCAEVKLLGEKVRIKEEELESMTKARLVAEDECKSKRDRLREDLDASGKQTLLAAHELMRMQYEDGLELLKAGVGEQTESLAAVIERHSTMDKSLSSTEPYDRAVGQLMGRLKSVLQHISSTVCLRVKPLLTCRIRENGARFAQQRLDLLSNDRNLRYKQLEAFRHNAAEAFSTFRKERRRQHQTRVDEVFGQSIFKAKSGLEGRLTASRQQFVQRHSAYIAEMHKSSQMTIDELVRKSTDDLMKLKGKQQQELKHAEERFSAELAHHARLFAAERDAAARCHHKACLPDFEVAMPSVNETLLKDTRVLRERLEQLKQSVLLDVQEASSLAKRERCDPLSIVEKERMLGLLEERTRHLSHQFTAQWHRFKSTVTSLQQDVENMSHGLREGRVRAAAYQQEVECVYSEWSQHVRRELSRCLVSGGAPSDASGVESGLNCMVQVIQRLLEQVRSITGAQCGRREEQRKFETGLRRELSSLTVKRELSRRALHGLLDAYEGLSSATAELEARRRILEVAQNDFKIAIELHEKERNEFERRVKKAEEAGVRLRHNSMKLERRSLRHGHSSRGFLPSTSCGVTIDNALNRRHHCASSMAHVKQQLYGLRQHGERLGDSGCSRGACRKRSVCAPSDTGSISRGENLMEFVSLLSLDDCALRPIASSSRETGELPSGSSSLV
ncbi:hypothetical protein ERJ75_000043300 [Trypanosoma vivax]|nr:hypothetical protein ERJ75_000043300 [Trypanosoma vivax]